VEAASIDQTLATFKNRDVEEPVDFWVNRRLASYLVRLLAPTPITPNQVTVLSGVAGIVAGIVIGTAPVGPRSLQVPVGGLLLYLSVLLDCADGQLARLRGESSLLGRTLDGFVDVIPTMATYFGFFFYLYRSGYGALPLNLLGWTSGYSMKWHVHAYDHAKNIYLRNVLPPSEQSSPLPTYEEIARETERLRSQGQWFAALALRGFELLSRAQRQGWQEGRMGLGVAATSTAGERMLYREAFVGSMRLWVWNGLASHLVVLLIGTMLAPWYPSAVLATWWFILIPMSALTLYLTLADRRAETTLQTRLGRTPALADVGH
jgi:phosphatidylglycerophosphate synthase